jgi:hypothetical protein
MGIVYIDKCRNEIQEQKEVPVWYTGIYPPISSIVLNWFLEMYRKGTKSLALRIQITHNSNGGFST